MGRTLHLLLGATALFAGSACGAGDSESTTENTASGQGAGRSDAGASGATGGASRGSAGASDGPGGASGGNSGGAPPPTGVAPGSGGSGGASSTGGGADGDASGGEASGGEGSAKEIVDPTGVWWTEIETIGAQNLPTVGLLEDTKIRFVMRVEVAGTVPNQTAKFEFCELQTEWANPLLAEDVHIIGFRPEATASFGETLPVDFSGLSVGSHVPVPDLTFIGGGDETGAILDEDGDGYPAITAFVRIILPFEVAEVITIDASLDVDAVDEETLMGTVDFDVEAEILDSNSAGFVPAGFDVTIVPDSDAVPITVRRLPGGGDCSTVPTTLRIANIPEPLGAPIDPLIGPQYNPDAP